MLSIIISACQLTEVLKYSLRQLRHARTTVAQATLCQTQTAIVRHLCSSAASASILLVSCKLPLPSKGVSLFGPAGIAHCVVAQMDE